jgi:hypothetical protein
MLLYRVYIRKVVGVQGGSNMTGTDEIPISCGHI